MATVVALHFLLLLLLIVVVVVIAAAVIVIIIIIIIIIIITITIIDIISNVMSDSLNSVIFFIYPLNIQTGFSCN